MNTALKQAMDRAGQTCETIAEAVGVNARTVSRWVAGERMPHPRHRAAVAAALGVDVYDLWPDARLQPAWLRPWLEVEREATTLRAFQLALIPGLLQTEAYARAVLAAWRYDAATTDELVAGRMQRQRVLHSDNPPYATFVVDETALRRGSPDIMRDQLGRLLDLGDRASLHVVPAGTGLYAGQTGPFTLATVDGRTLGVLEDPLSGQVTDDVDVLLHGWDAVLSAALPPAMSRGLVAQIVSEL